MLQNPAWTAVDELARAQLSVFHACCDELGLAQDGRHQALALDDRTWAAWCAFLDQGPLPAEPPLPEMLHRLGTTTFSLSVATERRAAAA